MEAAQEVHEGSGSRSEETVIFRDFLFQKTYAEEMLMCLYTYQFEQCYACQTLGDSHTCETTNILQHWNEAQHYFSRSEVMFRLNKRCCKYDEEQFSLSEFAHALSKVNTVWNDQISVMVIILDEKM